jgi:hypothetical protein
MFASMRGADSPKLGAVMGQVIETAKVVEATGTTASASAAPPVADENNDDSNDDDQGAAVRPSGANGAKPRASSSGKDRSSPTNSATTVDPMAHFHLILTELTPDEQAQVQHMVTTLSVRDLMQWYEQLANMPVADAAAMIRGELARVAREHKS